MAHRFGRRCWTCHDDTNRSYYCAKHEDSSNRPDNPSTKWCTWCATSLPGDTDGYECRYCDGGEEVVAERMYALEQRFKAMPSEATPDFRWGDCGGCGYETIQVPTVYRRGIWDGVVPGSTEPTGEHRCRNCSADNVL